MAAHPVTTAQQPRLVAPRKPGALALDAGALLLVLGVAAGARALFLASNPPMLLTTDSITYALPASQLVHGHGFDLSLRRTPGYPLFLAGLWALFGDRLQPVAVAQHLLGVGTAVLTWVLGRLALGRLAALLGGLATALSGPQIIYEHYLMTEALFTPLVVLGVLILVLAARRGAPAGYLLAGVIFGLCALIRPIGQAFILLVPLTALVGEAASSGPAVRGRRWMLARMWLALRAGLVALLGVGLVLLPWTVRNRLVGGELTSSSALGKTLFGRITRHDDGFRFDLPPAGPVESDARRAAARAMARAAAASDTSRGSLVHEQLMRDFGYSEAQAYNVMRDAALDIILAQPGYYLQSSLRGALQLLVSEDEPFRSHLDRLTSTRLRDEWQAQPTLASLLPAPVTPEERWQRHGLAAAVVRLYQPSEPPGAVIVLTLFVIGSLAIVLRPAWRPALALPLAALTVVVLSAFLDGPVIRFRYPVDPLISVTAGAGLSALGVLARGVACRARRARASGPLNLEAGASGAVQPRGAAPR